MLILSKSLRIHFETRETVKPYMYIFAEPMGEEKIEEIQTGERGTVEEFMAKIKEQIHAHQNPDAVLPESNEIEVENDEDALELKDTIEAGEIYETVGDVQAAMETTEAAEIEYADDTLEVSTSTELAKAEIENDMQQEEEVDEAFLKELQDRRDEDEEKDLFGVTLSIMNVVNGIQVKRPTHLQVEDKWEIGYNIAEFSTQAKAWSVYRALRARKKKAFRARLTSTDSDQVGQYQQYTQSLAAEGRDWEKLQEELDSGKEKIVFQPRCT